MQNYSIRSSSGAYRVLCGAGSIRRLSSVIGRQRAVSGVFLLSSRTAWKHCGATLGGALGRERAGNTILFDDAETAKSLSTLDHLCRELHRAGADRGSLLVAVGGGVVGDVAGFVAASYLRGIRLIHVPTTLVAQIDSSIGGKTGVNLSEGKNLVGAFYPPIAVVTDPAFLGTLPDAQFRSGLFEVVKYGVIRDAELFRFLERNMPRILRRDRSVIEWITARCVRSKASIVSKDERESGLRQILNFGHTFGHALEAAGRYRRHLHGEAIGWGMIVATLLALATDRIGTTQATRIIRVVTAVGPLPEIDAGHPSEFLAFMRGDKKSRAGRIRWVLPRAVGHVNWGIELPDQLVIAAIREAPEASRLARA